MFKFLIACNIILMPTICVASTDMVTCRFLFFHAQEKMTMQSVKNFILTFRWDAITQDAFMEGNNGLSHVVRINGKNGQTFLEILETGAVQSTTISNSGKAVHSRNSIIGDDLVAS